MLKKLIPVILAAALALCLSAAAADDADFLGKPFPDFSVTDTEGNTFTLSEALKDHDAVVINFWASWCPPCENEFPFLQETWEKYGDRVAFIALSTEEEDTVEKIAEYRESHGITFPMGRDEGMEQYSYLNINSIPDTVIVDRFGNAVFFHNGSFMNAGELERCLDVFLGEGYTQSSVLQVIPGESSTRAFPVSAKRGVVIENENVKTVCFRLGGSRSPLVCYIVPDAPAHIRLELSAADNPGTMVYNDLWGDFSSVTDLFDPERGAFVHDQEPEGTYGGSVYHFNYGIMYDSVLLDQDPDILEYFIVPDEQYIGEVEEELRASGFEDISWEFSEPESADSSLQAYALHIIDQYGNAVPEVTVNFCSDTACTPCESDETGALTFSGKPDVYHVQIVEVPDGYSFDESYELYTESTYAEWVLRIRKD